ncbi:MAG TPA: hypothetical protein VLH61_00250 [Bacteroidales bacterium]|nr:hypothetical protein [Bacteroidales bacterium]
MLELIAILVLIYLAFRVLTAFVLPFLVKSYIERVRRKFYQDNQTFNQNTSGDRKGVKITQDQKKKRGDSGKLGEYTDFEEVNDEKK